VAECRHLLQDLESIVLPKVLIPTAIWLDQDIGKSMLEFLVDEACEGRCIMEHWVKDQQVDLPIALTLETNDCQGVAYMVSQQCPFGLVAILERSTKVRGRTEVIVKILPGC